MASFTDGPCTVFWQAFKVMTHRHGIILPSSCLPCPIDYKRSIVEVGCISLTGFCQQLNELVQLRHVCIGCWWQGYAIAMSQCIFLPADPDTPESHSLFNISILQFIWGKYEVTNHWPLPATRFSWESAPRSLGTIPIQLTRRQSYGRTVLGHLLCGREFASAASVIGFALLLERCL